MKGTANHKNKEISKHCNDATLLCNSMLILKIYWQQCLALKLDDNFAKVFQICFDVYL